MSNAITPMIALGVTSYANNWYNTGSFTDVKPLLFAGIGALLLEGLASIPDMKTPAIAIGWLAFVGFILSPVQKPSPIDNLLNISKGKGK
jgi:hypothetical protein